jgi:2-hydroxy-3-keto-5-methylthiopentenyl-1-phosphate phosphatase
MAGQKTKVLATRIEKDLYQEIEKQADKKGISLAQYLRELLYSYHYPTSEIVSRLEVNRLKLDYSIDNAREYLEKLQNYSTSLQEAFIDFEKKIEGGAIQFPLRERELQGEQ